MYRSDSIQLVNIIDSISISSKSKSGETNEEKNSGNAPLAGTGRTVVGTKVRL